MAVFLVLVGGTSLALAVHIFRSIDAVEREYGHIRKLDEIHGLFHDVLFELHQVESTTATVRTRSALLLCEDLTRELDAFTALHSGEIESDERVHRQEMVGELRRLGEEAQAIARRMASTGRFSDLDLQWLDSASRLVPRTVGTLGRLDRSRIARRLASSQAALRAMVLLYVGFIVAGLALVAAGSFAVKHSLSRPLRQLSDAALGIAQGRFDARVPVRSSNEIGQLSHAFNVMSDRLEERERALHAAQEALEQKVHETQALYRLGTEISRLQQRDRILESVVDKARELLRADAAALCLFYPGRDGIAARVTSGPPEAFAPDESPDATTRALSGRITARSGVPGAACCSGPAGAARLAAPLRLGDDEMGVLWAASHEEREWSADEAELLSSLAMQAAIAVERARLTEELRGLAAVQERERLAREMHDGLAQALGLLHLKLQHALAHSEDPAASNEALSEMARIAGEAYEAVRQSIFELRTVVSRGLGLVPTLAEYLHEWSAQSGIAVDLAVPEGPIDPLPPASEVQAVRIIQEALTNVRKHARAHHARVSVERDGAWLRVAVEDDGAGWDAHGPTDRLHFGLQTMRERAEATGGRLAIDTTPGSGTRVVATLPASRA